MKNDRISQANESTGHVSAPQKLYKPRREHGDLRPEQVIPYVDDGPCDPGTADDLGGPG